jgi:transposase-like protein
MNAITRPAASHDLRAAVYCPICTHTVEARVVSQGKRTRVQPGQKCPRCSASLDAGYILQLQHAA